MTGGNVGEANDPLESRPVRLVLVDDEPLILSGLRAVLGADPEVEIVGEAADGTEALAVCARTRPDVVLMDVRMPGMDGLEATERLVGGAHPPDVHPPKVLVLTTFDSDDHVYTALRVGASGFLLKRWPGERILRAVHTVARGEAVVYPDGLARAVAEHGAPPARSDGQVEELLTEREQEVLRHMCRGMANAQIAQALYVSPETVKTQVSAILRKLEVSHRTAAVVRAFETGFVSTAASTAGRDLG
ncbi:response regulator transcription factor [Brevibacterium litoralis]|uniref:response regulator transcription factor n=1 Tax=Brevibacterium litoralis TaxID=3138935 RepID=UPI0032EB7B42